MTEDMDQGAPEGGGARTKNPDLDNTPSVHVEVAHYESKVISFDLAAPGPGWAVRAYWDEGLWVLETRSGARTTYQRFDALFDDIPETVEGVPVRAVLAERLDRNADVRPKGRTLLRRQLTDALAELGALYGDNEVAAWLAEEAGLRRLRLAADPDLQDVTDSSAPQAASTDPDHNPV